MNKFNQLTRREFLRYAARLGLSASSIALLSACGIQPAALTTDGQLETTRIRLPKSTFMCFSPQFLAEDYLRAEGFTDVQLVSISDLNKSMASGEIDVSMHVAPSLVTNVDAGDPITILTGIHVACYELFGGERVQAVRDLKGKTIGVSEARGKQFGFLSSIMTYIGLDPNKDVNWLTQSDEESMQSLTDGKIDAYLAMPPFPQEMRAKKIGRVILSSMMDKPWTQYFCCLYAGNREFVRKNPVATKRALRALLKASDLCSREPERVAHFLVYKGLTPNYEYALQWLKEMQEVGAYGAWREYDPEDTLRFYALRMREAGLIKSSPDDIIARGTDWRFLNELKKELKG